MFDEKPTGVGLTQISDAQKAVREREEGLKAAKRMAAERESYLESQFELTIRGVSAVHQLQLHVPLWDKIKAALLKKAIPRKKASIGQDHNFIKHVWYIEPKGKRVVVLPYGIAGAANFSKPGALKGAYIATMETADAAQELANTLKAYRKQQVVPPIMSNL